MRRALAACTLLVALAAGLALPRAEAAQPSGPALLVALRASAGPQAAASLRDAGGSLVDERLRLWRVPAGRDDVVAELRTKGHLRFAQAERSYAPTALSVTRTALQADPLSGQEWWRVQIGAGGLTAPGPGVAVTVVDSGVDFGHPEFSGRPDLEALNLQSPVPVGGTHGTMVSSLIGAPENGVGFIGVYPLARIRSWDAAPDNPNRLQSSEIVSGILAGARTGKGVINLSLGGDRDLSVELAVDEAVALGSLVVAASGNDGDEGNALSYPASLPHVLTVGATDSAGAVVSFSSTSQYVDVAAPGADVLVAETLRDAQGGIVRDWATADGTSFAAPLVSGAAAWIWTARPTLTADQVAETIRRTARDIGTPGRDPASGFGILNVSAALSAPAPVADLYEPNDDIDAVAPDGERNFANPPALTTRTRTSAALSSRVDRFEDPADVYRVWLPARRNVTFASTGTGDVDLTLYRTGPTSVLGSLGASYRLGRAQTRSTASERLVVRNAKAGRWAYLRVSPGRSSTGATYRLAISSR